MDRRLRSLVTNDGKDWGEPAAKDKFNKKAAGKNGHILSSRTRPIYMTRGPFRIRRANLRLYSRN